MRIETLGDALDLIDAGKDADALVKQVYAWLMRYKSREFNDNEAGDGAIYNGLRNYINGKGRRYETP